MKIIESDFSAGVVIHYINHKNLEILGNGFKFNNNSILGWMANESSIL